jgi:hypothetical protein
MRKLGRYCRAYPLSKLRQFGRWHELAENARMEECMVEGKTVLRPRTLTDSSYVFLQEDYTVTDGLFLGEHVIFEDQSSQWEQFCRETLEAEFVGTASVVGVGQAP